MFGIVINNILFLAIKSERKKCSLTSKNIFEDPMCVYLCLPTKKITFKYSNSFSLNGDEYKLLATEQWAWELPNFSNNDPQTHPTIDKQGGLCQKPCVTPLHDTPSVKPYRSCFKDFRCTFVSLIDPISATSTFNLS